MSNLNLPTLTVANLNNLRHNDNRRNLAFATVSHRFWDDNSADYGYMIQHHRSIIADIRLDRIAIGNAGWHSRTTADRLNRVLRHNGVPGHVRILQGRMILEWQGEKLPFDNINYGFVFYRNPDMSWVINGR